MRLFLPSLVVFAVASAVHAGEATEVALAHADATARGGLGLYLGAADSRSIQSLAAGCHLFILGMDADRERAARFRAELQATDVADRASVAWRRVPHIPCLDNLVNLLLAEGWGQGDLQKLPLAEVVRVLAPGGVAIVGTDKGGSADTLLAEANQVPLAAAEKLPRLGAWIKITKKLDPRFGEWTHFTGGAAQTTVATDTIAGPPSEVRWVNGPTWSSGGYRNDIVAGGRTFHEEKEWIKPGTGQVVLVARDAFNGCDLWREKIGAPTSAELGGVDRSLCADEKCVYYNEGTNLVARDAATGKLVRRYGPAQSMVTSYGNRLLASSLIDKATGSNLVALNSYPFAAHAVAQDDTVYLLRGGRDFGTSGAVEAFRLADGKSLWKVPYKEPEVRYKFSSAIACRGDNVYITLGLSVLALDRTNGATRWSYASPTNVAQGAVACLADKVCLTLAVKTGKEMHTERVYLDPQTGRELFRHPSPNPSARCWAVRNTDRYAIVGDGLFFEHNTGKTFGPAGGSVRPACGVGQAFAYGLTYDGPHACHCMVSLRGVLAVSPSSAVPKGTCTPQLIAETATATGPAATSNDWPTFRGDVGRSDSYAGTLPPQLVKRWSIRLDKAPLPQVTGAGNRLFVADPERQRVVALAVEHGKELWSFATEGRVSVAPTYHDGLCYFGDHAGWVYAVDAVSGKLAWQFQAAPEQKLMSAFDRFESAWPVKSGVLVVQDQACFLAGRCGSLDGGLYFYCVDAARGTLSFSTNCNDTRPTDLLVSDGRTVFYPYSREAPSTGKYAVPVANTNLPAPALLPRLSAAQTYHGYLAILNVLDTLDPLQAGQRKRGLIRGSNMADGDLIAFDRERTFISWSRGYWGQVPSREAVAGQEQVIRMDGSNKWVNRRTQQQMQALLLAGPRLYCAGVPRVRDTQESPTLWILSAEDGQEVQKIPLDGIPGVDGLSAVAGRLLLTTTDGQLICFGAP
jgi:outer membrane protein assembly factor BamB